MPQPPEDELSEPKSGPSKPVRDIIALLVVNSLIVIAVTVIGDLLALNGVHKMIGAALAWSIVFFSYGFWLRDRHGGFAVLLAMIALVAAILFGAMYASNPDLFTAIE